MLNSAQDFLRLVESDDPQDHQKSAHENASEATWTELINEHPQTKKWIAQNKTIPVSIIEILSDDDDVEVRWWIAIKRKLTPELFAKLANDPDETIRQRIACNAKTPASVLLRLANDVSDLVSKPAQERLLEEEFKK
jgi:hypothetical protein